MTAEDLVGLYERFEGERQALFSDIPGRWVIYTNTGVVGTFPDEIAAIEAAFLDHAAEPFIVEEVAASPARVVVGLNFAG